MDVVGRDRELAVAEEFLDSAQERFVVFALEGAAGIGKTTVWRELVRRAEDRGFLVLACRPTEAEAKLTLAALADLLEPVGDATIASLPEPQRRALDIALLREDPGKGAVDRRTLGAAVRSLLGELAAAGPTLVAVDDVQWLDAASAATLEFALRRLGPERIGFVVSRRLGEPAPLNVVELTEPERVTTATIGPLSLAALHHLLKERLGEAPARSALIRIQEASGGNPLFALEVARALADAGMPPPGEPLPVPSDIRELLRNRIAKLPRATREVLLAAAALAHPREEVISAALGRPIVSDLDPAERQQIAALERGEIAFAHPLFAGAVYASATTAARRRMHRRLAEAVDDSEARARQLALAAEGRDESAAAAANAAAADAAVRGAPAAAAELCELALQLTEPRSEAEPHRLLDAASYLHWAGETQRARVLLETVDSWERWPPQLHARGLDLLGELVSYLEGLPALAEFGRRVTDQSARVEVKAVGHLMSSYGGMQVDAERALEHAETALALLEQLGDRADPGILAGALTVRVRAGAVLGHGLDRELMDRALDLEARLPAERVAIEPVAYAMFGMWLRWVDDLDESRRLLERVIREAAANGHDTSRAVGLMHLAVTECLAGDLEPAREHSSSAFGIATDLGVGHVEMLAAHSLALVDAYVGKVEDARELCEQVRPFAAGAEGAMIDLDGTLGLLELSLGSYDAADAHLSTALEAFERAGFGEPGQFRIHADAGEAAVALGDLERAEEIADFLERHGERTNHRWSLATGARVRALLAAARGDLDAALAACEPALEHHEQLPMPIERARTLLVKGVIQRRARRRGRAKESFEQALEIFDRCGAGLWARRARTELDRLGLRRAAEELTENERHVAELAAQGMTNREVAAALYMSPKTVAANLSRVYQKLGISSRAELGARMAERVQT